MWLIILALAATIVTPIWYSKAEDDKYMIKTLCLILWGATIMTLIDHVMGYFMEGGSFLELTPEAAALGFTMLTAAFIFWEIILLLKDPKGVIRKKAAQRM
ncbi:MAG: hypothetical protein QXX99_00280 [Candidatus Bathyarchaeia archaeon]